MATVQVQVAYFSVRSAIARERIRDRCKGSAPVVGPGLHAASAYVAADAGQVDLQVIVQIGCAPIAGLLLAGARELLFQGEAAGAVVDKDVHRRLSASRAAADGAGLHANIRRGFAIEVARHDAGRNGHGICRNGKRHWNGHRRAERSVAVAEKHREAGCWRAARATQRGGRDINSSVAIEVRRNQTPRGRRTSGRGQHGIQRKHSRAAAQIHGNIAIG